MQYKCVICNSACGSVLFFHPSRLHYFPVIGCVTPSFSDVLYTAMFDTHLMHLEVICPHVTTSVKWIKAYYCYIYSCPPSPLQQSKISKISIIVNHLHYNDKDTSFVVDIYKYCYRSLETSMLILIRSIGIFFYYIMTKVFYWYLNTSNNNF